ncbi:DUF4212 domain-containing protein [Garicola koreensis]|uniref:Putative solute:sodium symporter small subunit n=1 Tax=Garicola koreensis TaxID=1262554 RepID=A0A7W5Y0D4_9MICC|nr:DUF4212 domain-containing protein [Garicola koreensis]MBB3668316.1 putative solute:sodium symporter small subunit [Garicola koreensis]
MSEVAHDSASQDPPGEDLSWRREYWKKNVRVLVVLLAVWASVSLGAGVLFIEQLNNIEILGFPLGLWFAQQGAIYTFVILILVYALWMDRIDDSFGVSERKGNGERS